LQIATKAAAQTLYAGTKQQQQQVVIDFGRGI